MLIQLLIGLMFLFFGVLVKYLKWYWLISGYNTMPKDKKRNVDIEGLGKFLGNSFFVMAGLLIASSLFSHYNYHLAATIAVITIASIIIFIMIKAQKFDGNTRRPDGTMNRSTKILQGGIKAKLYANASKPPFIEITTREGLIILNQGDPERTEALFQSLLHD